MAAAATTLAHYVNRPEVLARREAARQRVRLKMVDRSARTQAMSKLVAIHEGIRVGRRLDRVAVQLHELADEVGSVVVPFDASLRREMGDLARAA